MNTAVAGVMFHAEPKVKKHLRDQSRASDQTKWIMEAVSIWWNYYGDEPVHLLGVPTENILHRAALMIPRQTSHGSVTMPEPEPLAAAVEQARRKIRDSRWRVIVRYEKYGDHGIEYVARKLGMSVNGTRDYLKEAREALANVLRGMGWAVPMND